MKIKLADKELRKLTPVVGLIVEESESHGYSCLLVYGRYAGKNGSYHEIVTEESGIEIADHIKKLTETEYLEFLKLDKGVEKR